MNDNDVVIKARNMVLLEKSVRFRQLLVGGLANHIQPQVVSALRATLSRYLTPHGVWALSSTWFISSRNPS